MTYLVVAIFIFLWLVVGPVIFHITEKKKYNKGCPCGGQWRYFDSDSQGGDGYTCDKCGNVMWISWYKPRANEKETKVIK